VFLQYIDEIYISLKFFFYICAFVYVNLITLREFLILYFISGHLDNLINKGVENGNKYIHE